ncbi:MAG TPA: T9SS type A sorting domain-containing protein [Ignavibacteriaceae bacterium]|nr:T9SS type A sorting domain-containing protein [Ignavibacteriaceae bacterium]
MKHFHKLLITALIAYGSISLLFAQSEVDPPVTDDPFVLLANPGPANNGGSAGWAMFLNLIAAPTHQVTITDMTTASNAGAGVAYTIEFFVRQGNALGGPVGSGPGSSSAGWTSLGVVPVTQGPTANGISLLFATPVITINPGDTAGVAMQFFGVGPRYFGTGTPPYEVYSNTGLTLVTGDVRTAPFTPGGSFFSSRALVGEVHYDAVVPVELVSFTASVTQLNNENAVELSWMTATELNNSGFNVERKTKDTDWENISFVDGHGTTTEAQSYSFIDRGLSAGSYSYRLKQVDFDGSFTYHMLSETMEIGTIKTFALEQNYPNPFNPATTISYQLPTEGQVSIKVFDMLGNEVATLVNEIKTAGEHQVEFNAGAIASGIYFYRLQAGSFVETKRMMLMK